MAVNLDDLKLERIRLEMLGPHLIATLDHAPTKNALTDQLMGELNKLIDNTSDDLSIRSLVLRGANGVFCAGADLKAALQRMEEPVGDSVCQMYCPGYITPDALSRVRYQCAAVILFDGCQCSVSYRDNLLPRHSCH